MFACFAVTIVVITVAYKTYFEVTKKSLKKQIKFRSLSFFLLQIAKKFITISQQNDHLHTKMYINNERVSKCEERRRRATSTII